MQDKKETKQEKFRYGFIAVDGSDIGKGVKPNERVCCALVSLAGNDFSIYNVDSVLFFGYNSKKIAEELLKINAKSFYIDEEHLSWLAPDWYQETNKIFVKENISSPKLIGRQRDKDLLRRQANALSFIKSEGHHISFSNAIPKEVIALIAEPGKSVVPDAVAGAIEVCKERTTYAQKLTSVNPKRPDRWLGIPRWNEKIAEEK